MMEERHEQQEQRQRYASEGAAKLARMDGQIAALLSDERQRRDTSNTGIAGTTHKEQSQ